MLLKQVFAHCLHPSDTCFDIGANIGQSAEIMAPLVGPTGQCHSFECHPIHFTRLAFLASRPGFENISPYCRAMSDRPGHIMLHTGGDPAACQASTIVPALATNQRLGSTIARLKVETDTIDRFCAAHDVTPNLIKIDVEGAEAQVFAGARATFTRCLPHVVFEFGYGFDHGQTPYQYTLLHELGYELYLVDLFQFHGKPFWVLDEVLRIFAINPEDIRRTHCSGNLLAIHRSKTSEPLNGVKIHAFEDVAKYRLNPS